MDVDSGIYRKLPQWVTEDQKPPDINERNVFVVGINVNNDLFVEGAYADLYNLKDRVKEFILNPLEKENLSEKEPKFIEPFGELQRSKGVVSLTNDRGTDYGAYIRVQNELVAAFNELRDEFSYARFGKKFKSLDEDLQKAVRDFLPTAISEAEPVEIKR
ncbi:unnamed protein product [marine sediment metagenome]|uniref:Uncharacterized protein n=1 Tax=marine sediment metagenome TaxID=412755 RepID=X1TRV3_9ZZZZ